MGWIGARKHWFDGISNLLFQSLRGFGVDWSAGGLPSTAPL
ncbi:hypothetical protein GFS31_43870 (plasmid) [Leptolyngbya sp. BL0902]|nr:hypothetical protein GFS31_43870 [Leptolyngbya sp. BL0902]